MSFKKGTKHVIMENRLRSDAEKAPWNKKADKDKERFDKEIASGMTVKPRKLNKFCDFDENLYILYRF